VVEYAQTRLAEIDETTTEEDIVNCVGYRADVNDISFVVCTWNGCNKYFTKMEKFTQHRRRDHDTEEVTKDIWIFGNVNKGGETSTNTISSKATESESSTSIQKTTTSPVKVSAPLPINPSSPLMRVDGTSTLTPTTTTIGLSNKPRRPIKDQLDLPNPMDNSLPAKRSRDSSALEKEIISKRRETQASPQFPGGHSNNGNGNNDIRQVQRPPRRFTMEEEQIVGPDARIRYPRGNRGPNANPMYGLPYDTGDPRYYNAMQMHPMNFVYSEMPPPPPPRYDGSYGDMPYGQFYGNGNRRFLNSPPPPPPPTRRSR
ncbi:12607_t:CDS:1, partial [Acaulospora morrowiae]